jgi:hypothetical protein
VLASIDVGRATVNREPAGATAYVRSWREYSGHTLCVSVDISSDDVRPWGRIERDTAFDDTVLDKTGEEIDRCRYDSFCLGHGLGRAV